MKQIFFNFFTFILGFIKKEIEYVKKWLNYTTHIKVRVATMIHDHDDTPHAILTLLVVLAGKWENL